MALLGSMKRSVEEEAEDGLIVPKKVLYTPTHPLWLYPHFFVCAQKWHKLHNLSQPEYEVTALSFYFFVHIQPWFCAVELCVH